MIYKYVKNDYPAWKWNDIFAFHKYCYFYSHQNGILSLYEYTILYNTFLLIKFCYQDRTMKYNIILETTIFSYYIDSWKDDSRYCKICKISYWMKKW
jgi:hypothetical protein